MRKSRFVTLPSLTAGIASLVAGCATQAPASAPAEAPVAVPRPSPSVYFYPLQGQPPEQQDRDRYECYLWARRQTGFDPSVPPPAGRAPVKVEAVPPPGYGVAAGAATGAVIGAAVSHPWESVEGAAIGAVAGAMIGAAADASRQEQAAQIEARENATRAEVAQQFDADVIAYRNALEACLSARGYAVR